MLPHVGCGGGTPRRRDPFLCRLYAACRCLAVVIIVTSAAIAHADPPRHRPRMATTDEAIVRFKSRAQSNDRDYISRTVLARLYIRKAQQEGDEHAYANAEAAAREALAINPKHHDARAVLAASMMARHAFTDAIATARVVLKTDPANITALATIGDGQLELGDYEAAAATYDALHERSKSPAVLVRIARLHELHGRDDQAIALARRALEQVAAKPGVAPAAVAWYEFRLGDLLFKAGRIDEAARLLARAHEHAPNLHGPILRLARVRQAQQRYDNAVALLRPLADSAPAVDHYAELADTHRLAGNTALAKKWMDQAIAAADDPDLPEFERGHLIAFLTDHDLQHARAVQLARAELASRKDVYTHDALAWALYRAGKFDQADAHMKQALRLGTRDPKLHFHATLISLARDDTHAARKHLAVVRSRNPLFHPALTVELQAALQQLKH